MGKINEEELPFLYTNYEEVPVEKEDTEDGRIVNVNELQIKDVFISTPKEGEGSWSLFNESDEEEVGCYSIKSDAIVYLMSKFMLATINELLTPDTALSNHCPAVSKFANLSLEVYNLVYTPIKIKDLDDALALAIKEVQLYNFEHYTEKYIILKLKKVNWINKNRKIFDFLSQID